MEMFKGDQKTFDGAISSYASGRRYATFYTAIELNRWFLKTLVEHHEHLKKVKDVAAAKLKLSNQYGRIPKYSNILEVYMLRLQGGVSADYRIYLTGLESVIFDISLKTENLVKKFVGSFEDHPLSLIHI